MRVLSFIMAFLVLFLSSERALAMFEQKEEIECCSSCHNDDNVPEEKGQGDNPCSDNCNPFQPCASCTGYTIDFRTFTLISPIERKSGAFIFEQQSYFHFFADVWQPPKIA